MNTTWKQMLITFLIGLSVGVFVDGSIHRFGPHKPWGNHDPEKWMLERYCSKLHLTNDQKTKVQKILEETRPRMIALRTEVRPKFEAIRNSANTKIRQLLNDQQKQKFDKMEAEWEARMKKIHGGDSKPI